MGSGKRTAFKACLSIFLVMLLSAAPIVLSAEKKPSAQAKAVQEVVSVPPAASPNPSIDIEFTGKKPDIRIARVDENEIMIAFKMKAEGDDFKIGAGKQKFDGLRYEKLPDGAGAVFIKTREKIESTDSSWDKDGRVLTVSFKPRKHDEPKKIEAVTADPQKQEKNQEHAEFMKSIKGMPCLSDSGLSAALRSIENEEWEGSIELLDEFLTDTKGNGRCSDAASFLKAYSFFMSKGKDDSSTARALLQEMMVGFPDSPYVPYAALFLGQLELQLTGYGPAAGYFNYILTDYPDFRAKPQVLYGYAISNINLDNLVSAYKNLSELANKYPESVYNETSSLQQGKIFFKRGDYADALKRFEVYYAKHKDDSYESPDLLYYLGSSAYHSGNYKKAIEYLSMAYNLFPEIQEPDILFSRIADSYVEEGQLAKARKIYELVRSKYAGTDGFAISSVRLAGIVDDQTEKEEIYQEVIDGFPENPLSKLSLLKLAKAKYDSGDYEGCIDRLRTLVDEKPGAAKKEADALLLLATEKFFSTKYSEGKAFDAIRYYELEKKGLEPYMTPKIHYIIGKSYLDLKLYGPAYEHLSSAAPSYAGKAKPPGFDYALATALDETGRSEEAKGMLVSASSAESSSSVDALMRLARIQKAEGKNDEALATYRDAFSRSQKNDERASILLDQSAIFEENKDTEGVVSLMAKAEELIGKDSGGKNRDVLLTILQKRGESEAKIGNYSAASSALERALALKNEGEVFEEISFQLAELYEKQKKVKEASEILKKLSEGDNDFWAKLAKERLEQLTFFDRLKGSDKKLAS